PPARHVEARRPRRESSPATRVRQALSAHPPPAAADTATAVLQRRPSGEARHEGSAVPDAGPGDASPCELRQQLLLPGDRQGPPRDKPARPLPLRLRLDPSKLPPPLSSLEVNLPAAGASHARRRRLSSPSVMFRGLSAIFGPLPPAATPLPLSAPSTPRSLTSRGGVNPVRMTGSPPGASPAAWPAASADVSPKYPSESAPFCIRNLYLLGQNGTELYLSSRFDRIQANEFARKIAVPAASAAAAGRLAAPNPFSVATALRFSDCNRYVDVLPYEWSRVRLGTLVDRPVPPEKCGRSYINASHLVSPDGRLRYISTQAPLAGTQAAFWQMVHSEGSRVIVMLCKEEENTRIMCHGYWPMRTDAPLSFQDVGLSVALTSTSRDPGSGCTVRTLALALSPSASASSSDSQSDARVRLVTQIHFTDWPDHGVPASPETLLRVIRLANSVQEAYIRDARTAAAAAADGLPDDDPDPGPMVVHCSAGVGRSGTFCVVDAALGSLDVPGFGIPPRPLSGPETAALDVPRKPTLSPLTLIPDERDVVYDLVEYFRLHRPLIVQTPCQFIYCYAAVNRAWFEARLAAPDSEDDSSYPSSPQSGDNPSASAA
ncbi:MAG: protein-tyrosine phosphatase-like protein, partial [Olpidium bornovanus]